MKKLVQTLYDNHGIELYVAIGENGVVYGYEYSLENLKKKYKNMKIKRIKALARIQEV